MVVVLRDLPGIASIEAAARLNYALRGEDHDYAERVRNARLSVFGVASDYFEWPEWCLRIPVDRWPLKLSRKVTAAATAWFDHFEPMDATDEEAPAVWRALGWDVTDGAGAVLRCLDDFAGAMVCVTKGLRGKTLEEVGASAWAAQLGADRKPTPEQIDRNARFLALGRRARPSRRNAGRGEGPTLPAGAA